MSHGQATTSSTVLLIEADPSLRRIITLGLQQYDLNVIAASSLSGLPLSDGQSPDLIVLDIDNGARQNWCMLEEIRVMPHLAALPVIVLAWDTHGPATSVQLDGANLACLEKPFDARALYRIIKHQLAQREEQQARTEARLLASYTHQTSPSIWPVVTAAGLLLAVIGLLLQVAVAIVGLLIVAMAVLVWTIMRNPHPTRSSVVPALHTDSGYEAKSNRSLDFTLGLRR